jgi:hypothetical protein
VRSVRAVARALCLTDKTKTEKRGTCCLRGAAITRE